MNRQFFPERGGGGVLVPPGSVTSNQRGRKYIKDQETEDRINFIFKFPKV